MTNASKTALFRTQSQIVRSASPIQVHGKAQGSEADETAMEGRKLVSTYQNKQSLWLTQKETS